jgi:ankyrin repeat protein
MAEGEGKAPMVRLLLEKGANPNDTGSQGVTPLMVAILKGSYSISEILLTKGASLAAKATDGSTALKFARDQHYTALANLLTAAGAKD